MASIESIAVSDGCKAFCEACYILEVDLSLVLTDVEV